MVSQFYRKLIIPFTHVLAALLAGNKIARVLLIKNARQAALSGN